MGYKIKVDHDKLMKLSKSLKEDCSKIKKIYKELDLEVDSKSEIWIGTDRNHFNTKWNGILERKSVTDSFLSNIESYASNLEKAANMYKKAQAKAVNQSMKISKF